MNTVPGATSLGISLGTGNLYAVPGPEAVPVRHSAVLTIWPTAPDGGGSAPEGGTATENPRLRPGGLTITGFIDRLGDPVPITAPDGGAHAAESLTADAIRSIARAATGGFPTASTAVVAYPGWWPGDRVAALRDTLGEQVTDVAAPLLGLEEQVEGRATRLAARRGERAPRRRHGADLLSTLHREQELPGG